MTTVEVLVIVYGSCSRDPQNDDRFGWEQRRVEITLNPTLPANATTIDKKQEWLQEFLRNIGLDMKHNRNWRCEFCSASWPQTVPFHCHCLMAILEKPARETVWMSASWTHLTPPRSNSYVSPSLGLSFAHCRVFYYLLFQVHHVCDAGAGPCSEQLREINAYMAEASGFPPSGLPRQPKRKGQEKFPMSSSCAVCHNEADESRKNLKQCAKCELTRYCRSVDFSNQPSSCLLIPDAIPSVDCQRTDWKRHKECCKAVKEVKWHWN
jgi:hypothetical protein